MEVTQTKRAWERRMEITVHIPMREFLERREQEKKQGFGEISFLKFERERISAHSKDRKRQNLGMVPKTKFLAGTNFETVSYSSIQQHRFRGDLYS